MPLNEDTEILSGNSDEETNDARNVIVTKDNLKKLKTESSLSLSSDSQKAMFKSLRSDIRMPNVWIYDGEAYDLSSFVKKHPGGEYFIYQMKNRDITILVNILHRNPAKAKKMLAKYALGRKATAEDVHPKYNAPSFLFKDDFNAWRDIPKFDFKQPSQLLDNIRPRLNEPQMRERIERMDFVFNATTLLLTIAYIGVQLLRLQATPMMPIYLFVPLMVALRLSLSGAGHYFNHRALVGWNKVFAHIFDLNYVPMAFVVVDGHTLMHHPSTQSEVDVKRKVFTAMMELPRGYRLPVHTIHKLGHVFTGMFIRAANLCIIDFDYFRQNEYASWKVALPRYFGLIGMRVLLCGEAVLFWQQGEIVAWFAQFLITVWISTFLLVASHDFEKEESAVVPEGKDWAVFQINQAYDLKIVGNKYIDCFLSAGLSPHRVHHVLPYQKSGFANIISEDIVREEAAKVGVTWFSPRSFFSDRLPTMAKHYLLSPSRSAKAQKLGFLQEHLQPQALRTSLNYLYLGFMGVGSI